MDIKNPEESQGERDARMRAEGADEARSEMAQEVYVADPEPALPETIRLTDPRGSYAPRMQVIVPDGTPVADVASLAAFLLNEIGLVLGPPQTAHIPVHLAHFFRQV